MSILGEHSLKHVGYDTAFQYVTNEQERIDAGTYITSQER